jgi:hypothetical protein
MSQYVPQTPVEICDTCGFWKSVNFMTRQDGSIFRPCETCPVSAAKNDSVLGSKPFQQPA